MTKYIVSYKVIYTEPIMADSLEEAVNIVAAECPYEIDDGPFVTNWDTGETFDLT